MKKILIIFILSVLLVGCTPDKEANQDTRNPVATITFTDGKEIEIELYPDIAPNTVNNFIFLINDGFYDGLTFHRIIDGFMMQGGDPEGTGTGGPDYAIAGEFTSNGFENNLSHEFGVISMARSQDPNSAGSQFFIMNADNSGLDGDYAAFGKVISGEDVVREKSQIATGANDYPLEISKVTIDNIKVETFGVTYPEPEKY